MQKPKIQLDKRIAKICLYRGITLIIALAVVMALYLNRGFFTHIWEIIIAVLRPIVIGGMLAYLLAPIARRMEAVFSKDGTGKWARPVSVALSYLVLALFVLVPLALILLALYKTFDAVSVSGIKEFFEMFKGGVGDLTDTLIEKLGAFGISEDKLKEAAAAFMGSAKTAGSGLLFGIIFSVYFLLDRGNIGEYWLRAYNLITGGKHKVPASRFSRPQSFSASFCELPLTYRMLPLRSSTLPEEGSEAAASDLFAKSARGLSAAGSFSGTARLP